MSYESPTKKMKVAREQEPGYVQMPSLTKNKAYKIYKIEETNHAEYGKGQMAYIIQQSKKKNRVQLPTKFLRMLKDINANAIPEYIAAIRNGKHPYLVFRGVDIDKSYEIDIFDSDADIIKHYQKWTDVPVLETSGPAGTPPLTPERMGTPPPSPGNEKGVTPGKDD